MASKASKAPRKAEGAKALAEQVLVDDEGYYRIPPLLLMEYRAKDSECRHAHLALRVVTQELDQLLTKYPDVQKKMAEKAALAIDATNTTNAIREVHAQLEKTFGVSIQNISIDDESGRIYQLVDGKQAEEPMRPAKKKAKRAG